MRYEYVLGASGGGFGEELGGCMTDCEKERGRRDEADTVWQRGQGKMSE